MRALLRSMRPDSFEDISAVLALYRPGPMGVEAHYAYADRKTGRKPVEPIHPELAEPLADILDDTYGVIVYQEQVQKIAQKLAGYSLGQADLLRRAMGKKKKEILDKEFGPFSDGHGAPTATRKGAINKLWETLVPFADYAFNKAAHRRVRAWCRSGRRTSRPTTRPSTWRRCSPASATTRTSRPIYLNECRRMGIKVLPPDVNESAADFTPVGTDIRFGLTAIRNVGGNVVAGLVERPRRSKAASPTSTTSWRRFRWSSATSESSSRWPRRARSTPSATAGARSLEVHEDAADRHDRRQAQRGDRPRLALRRPRRRRVRASPIREVPSDVTEWDKRTLLAYERDMLGLYVSDHPLNGLEHVLAQASDVTIGQLVTDEERPGGHGRHRRRAGHVGRPQDHQARATSTRS